MRAEKIKKMYVVRSDMDIGPPSLLPDYLNMAPLLPDAMPQ
jgi:hypothetical protein